MGNLINNLKKFLTNKNTVTILGIIAGVIVLWFFYNYRLNQAINPQSVPIAKRTIEATEQVTQDDFELVEVNSEFLKKANVITNTSQLIGYYVNVGTSIPEGGLFYASQIVEKKELPNSIFDNIPEGYTITSLSVNNETTFANSIYPGDRIDLYLRTTDDEGRIVYGALIESIEVLAVRDSQGNNVFDSSTNRNSAYLLFAVPSKSTDGQKSIYDLLEAVKVIPKMEILPVPRNKMYTEEAADTKVSSSYLRAMVEAQMAFIPQENQTQ